ncbi:LCP family protein [Anaerovibrio sp.]|uniref:LCP family protein n=1 Tax=Anaerovibrio sp. TaxID=1872532 RepID=UPI003F1425E2
MRVRRRRRRNFTRVYILAAVLLVALAGVLATSFSGGGQEENYAAAESGIERPDDYAHIMVMGVDRRSDDAGRSDTLMVVTINRNTGKAEILSLPRDTRVRIEGNGYDKINHAYAFGGSKLTRKTVEELLGVPMDYYVLVDVKAFERIIDAMDGIDIDVEKRMYYEDPWDDNGGLVIDLYPGMQHMTGDKAIQYVRYRDGEGDIGRIGRQQHFMRAVMEKMLSPSILPKLPQLAEEIQSAVETDMPLTEMVAMVQLLPSIREQGMESVMVPGKPAYLEDVSYWLPDIMGLRALVSGQMGAELADRALANAEKVRAQYDESLPKGLTVLEENTGTAVAKNTAGDGGETEKKEQQENEGRAQAEQVQKPARAEGPGGISVLIINDSGINGAAARLADRLRDKGFNVTGVDTGRKSDRGHTIIVTDSSNTEWFYGMPFPCTIMDGGEPNEAVVYIGQDYE